MKLTKTHWILLVLIAIAAICLFIKNKRASTSGNKSTESAYKKTSAQLIRDCYKSGGDPIVTLGGTFVKCD